MASVEPWGAGLLAERSLGRRARFDSGALCGQGLAWRRCMVRLLVLLTAVVLTACTPPVKKDADWVRAEFAKEEAKGTAFGQLLSAVREAEPDIYGQFAG